MTAPPPLEQDRSFWLLAALSVCFTLMGWFFQSDVQFTEGETSTAYSVTLTDECLSGQGRCKVIPRDPLGFRPEVSRNEVVYFSPRESSKQLGRWSDCTIWDGDNWACENSQVIMWDGIMQKNAFDTARNVYYVPKIAWKMAKLHILPVSSVQKDYRPPKRKSAT